MSPHQTHSWILRSSQLYVKRSALPVLFSKFCIIVRGHRTDRELDPLSATHQPSWSQTATSLHRDYGTALWGAPVRVPPHSSIVRGSRHFRVAVTCGAKSHRREDSPKLDSEYLERSISALLIIQGSSRRRRDGEQSVDTIHVQRFRRRFLIDGHTPGKTIQIQDRR